MKPVVYLRRASVVPAETQFPGAVRDEQVVLTGLLASAHPALSSPVGTLIRTELITYQDLAARRFETGDTIYEVVQ